METKTITLSDGKEYTLVKGEKPEPDIPHRLALLMTIDLMRKDDVRTLSEELSKDFSAYYIGRLLRQDDAPKITSDMQLKHSDGSCETINSSYWQGIIKNIYSVIKNKTQDKCMSVINLDCYLAGYTIDPPLTNPNINNDDVRLIHDALDVSTFHKAFLKGYADDRPINSLDIKENDAYDVGDATLVHMFHSPRSISIDASLSSKLCATKDYPSVNDVNQHTVEYLTAQSYLMFKGHPYGNIVAKGDKVLCTVKDSTVEHIQSPPLAAYVRLLTTDAWEKIENQTISPSDARQFALDIGTRLGMHAHEISTVAEQFQNNPNLSYLSNQLAGLGNAIPYVEGLKSEWSLQRQIDQNLVEWSNLEQAIGVKTVKALRAMQEACLRAADETPVAAHRLFGTLVTAYKTQFPRARAEREIGQYLNEQGFDGKAIQKGNLPQYDTSEYYRLRQVLQDTLNDTQQLYDWREQRKQRLQNSQKSNTSAKEKPADAVTHPVPDPDKGNPVGADTVKTFRRYMRDAFRLGLGIEGKVYLPQAELMALTLNRLSEGRSDIRGEDILAATYGNNVDTPIGRQIEGLIGELETQQQQARAGHRLQSSRPTVYDITSEERQRLVQALAIHYQNDPLQAMAYLESGNEQDQADTAGTDVETFLEQPEELPRVTTETLAYNPDDLSAALEDAEALFGSAQLEDDTLSESLNAVLRDPSMGTAVAMVVFRHDPALGVTLLETLKNGQDVFPASALDDGAPLAMLSNEEPLPETELQRATFAAMLQMLKEGDITLSLPLAERQQPAAETTSHPAEELDKQELRDEQVRRAGLRRAMLHTLFNPSLGSKQPEDVVRQVADTLNSEFAAPDDPDITPENISQLLRNRVPSDNALFTLMQDILDVATPEDLKELRPDYGFETLREPLNRLAFSLTYPGSEYPEDGYIMDEHDAYTAATEILARANNEFSSLVTQQTFDVLVRLTSGDDNAFENLSQAEQYQFNKLVLALVQDSGKQPEYERLAFDSPQQLVNTDYSYHPPELERIEQGMMAFGNAVREGAPYQAWFSDAFAHARQLVANDMRLSENLVTAHLRFKAAQEAQGLEANQMPAIAQHMRRSDIVSLVGMAEKMLRDKDGNPPPRDYLAAWLGYRPDALTLEADTHVSPHNRDRVVHFLKEHGMAWVPPSMPLDARKEAPDLLWADVRAIEEMLAQQRAGQAQEQEQRPRTFAEELVLRSIYAASTLKSRLGDDSSHDGDHLERLHAQQVWELADELLDGQDWKRQLPSLRVVTTLERLPAVDNDDERDEDGGQAVGAPGPDGGTPPPPPPAQSEEETLDSNPAQGASPSLPVTKAPVEPVQKPSQPLERRGPAPNIEQALQRVQEHLVRAIGIDNVKVLHPSELLAKQIRIVSTGTKKSDVQEKHKLDPTSAFNNTLQEMAVEGLAVFVVQAQQKPDNVYRNGDNPPQTRYILITPEMPAAKYDGKPYHHMAVLAVTDKGNNNLVVHDVEDFLKEEVSIVTYYPLDIARDEQKDIISNFNVLQNLYANRAGAENFTPEMASEIGELISLQAALDILSRLPEQPDAVQDKALGIPKVGAKMFFETHGDNKEYLEVKGNGIPPAHRITQSLLNHLKTHPQYHDGLEGSDALYEKGLPAGIYQIDTRSYDESNPWHAGTGVPAISVDIDAIKRITDSKQK